MGEKVVLRGSEMNAGTSQLTSVVTDLMTTVDGINGKFSGAKDAGFLNGMLGTISKQSSSIGNSVNSIKRTISNKATDLFDIDHKGAQAFNEIEICTDFYANNDSEQNEYNKVLIDKMDDKSVNEGQVTNSVDVHGDETTVKGVGLVDITGEEGKEHDRQHTNVVQEAIGNVNVAEDKGVTVDADSNVTSKAISNIKKDENGQARESGDANVIDANLVNVNNQLQMNASGNVNVNANKQTLGSTSNSGSTGTATSSNIISEKAEIPLSTAAYTSSTSENKDTKQSSVGMGIAAGLVGAAGIAGLMGASREEKKENEEKEEEENKEKMIQATEEAKETAEKVEEDKNEDDTNHLNG